MQLRALGMMACFVVSGLVHELMYWYVQRSMTGLWLVFFSLQVRCKPCSMPAHKRFVQICPPSCTCSPAAQVHSSWPPVQFS
jgi:hypothetical protein